jgi:hypothetical protein
MGKICAMIAQSVAQVGALLNKVNSMKFVFDIVLKLAVRVFPLLGVFAVQKYKIAIVSVYAVVFALSEYFLLVRPEKRLQERAHKILDHILKPLIDNARYKRKKPSLRINIMRVRPFWYALYVRFSRWPVPEFFLKIIEPSFIQIYEYGMTGQPDANLSIKASRGFCGHCFRRQMQQTYYKDTRDMNQQDAELIYMISHDEYEKTKHITAITCTPLIRKKKSLFGRELPEDQYFGVLNIDATDDVGADYLKQEKVLKEIEALSVIVQEMYS